MLIARSAEPTKTGIIFPLSVPARRPPLSSSIERLSSSMYFSKSSSSSSAMCSISSFRCFSAMPAISAGISPSFILRRSITPQNPFPSSIGNWRSTTPFPHVFFAASKSGRNETSSPSILFTKIIRGRLSSSAYFHTFSVPVSMPDWAETMITAPSTTRRLSLTSPAKSA